jgi:hypothetical protein
MGLWHMKFKQPTTLKKEDNGRSNNGEDTQVEAASTTDDALGHDYDLPDDSMDDDPA